MTEARVTEQRVNTTALQHRLVALVGMSSAAHVRENLGVAAVEPATPEQYARLYQ